MGTDIHAKLEVYDNYDDKWTSITVPEFVENRYYRFFAGLADVRNGAGFAGVYTHDSVKPLTSNRGLPDDAATHGDGDWDYGDHSYGYATLKEIKSYDWQQVVIKGGVMPLNEYLLWDHVSRPQGLCGGIYGKNIVTVDESDVHGVKIDDGMRYYVNVRFKEPLVDKDFTDKLISFMELYVPCNGDDETVRLVFGFDS